jgi:hypothetical protein
MTSRDDAPVAGAFIEYISARLKDAGYCNELGEQFNPQSVRAMIEGPQARPPRRP